MIIPATEFNTSGSLMLFPLDDAYITLDNARTLLTGVDHNYGQPALVGATSPIHLALVAGLGMLFPLAAASLVINAAAATAYAAALWAVSGLGGAKRTLRLGILGIGLAAAIPHLFNGLETGLALAGVAWSLVLASRSSAVALPLLLGSLPFVRPDLAPWSLALTLWRAYVAGRDVRDWRAGARRLGADLSLVFVAATPWLAWTSISLGTLFPSTVIAKRAFFAQEGLPLSMKALIVTQILFGSLLAPLALALVAGRRAPLAIPISATLFAFLAAYTMTFPGGLFHNNFRYLALVVPFCLYGVAYTKHMSGLLTKIGTFTFLVVLATTGVFRLTLGYQLTADDEAAAVWAREHLAPNARVLVHDAGIPAWETGLRLVDVVGLKSPESIPQHVRLTAPTLGRERAEAVSRIALASGATHAIVLDDPFWIEIDDDLRRKGWGLDLLRKPTVSPGYWIYALTPPAALRAGLD